MPVNFLSEDQKAGYGNYHGELTKETLARYFHLDDFDRLNISEKRGEHNRLGYAVLLCTVRYLGRFPDLTTIIPIAVTDFLAEQLCIESGSELVNIYNSGKQRRQHIGRMKFISFRISSDNYNKLKDAIMKLSGKKPTAFFSALANKIISQHTTDVDTVSCKESTLSNVRQIRLSDEMLNQLTLQADSRHWLLAKEIRFMLNLAMTTQPVLLDEEVEELRRARNAVNTAGRNLATIIRQRQYHDVKETELWEAVKKLNKDVEDVKKSVRQLTNAAVNVRSVKIRNTPK